MTVGAPMRTGRCALLLSLRASPKELGTSTDVVCWLLREPRRYESF